MSNINSQLATQQDPYMNKYGCPPAPTPSREQEINSLANILEASGVQACNQTSSQSAGMFAGAALTLGGVGGVGGSFRTLTTSNLGCEQIFAASKRYEQAVQNVSCIINKSSTTNKVNTSAVNSIEISAGENLVIGCNLEVDQTIGVTVVSEINLSEQEISDIADETKAVVKQFSDAVLDSTTEAGATPQGQKIYMDTQNLIKDINYKQKVKDSVREISTNINSENKLVIKAKNVSLTGNLCKFKQGIVLDIIATNIINSVVSDTLKTISSYDVTTQDTAKVTSKATVPGLLDFLGLGGLGSFGWIIFIVGILVLIGIIGVVIYAVYKIGKKVTQGQNSQDYEGGGDFPVYEAGLPKKYFGDF